MDRRPIALALVLAALSGSAAFGESVPVCEPSPSMTFEPQSRIGTGSGYEPGIEIDSRGNIWTTAHKLSLVREEGTRLSSYLYRSTDDGQTFQDVADILPGVHPLWALEGDLAVDAKDRMYFVDTYAADNNFYRFGPDAELELAKPALPSGELDDRPWLAAHGDGYLYYMSNTAYTPNGRLTVHRSSDGGLTFDSSFLFPDSGWGFLDADPNSDHVYAVMNDLFYGTGTLGDATAVYAWTSPDRGLSWDRVKIADYEFGYNETDDHDDAYPVVAVSPVDGSVYAAWTDDGKKLMLARSTDRGSSWEVEDVSPFEATFSYPWVTVGADGTLAVSFEALRPGQAFPQQEIYAMIVDLDPECEVDGKTCEGPSLITGRVNQVSIGADANSQADFFQLEISPTTGRIHVVWTGKNRQLYHARQASGPNLSNTASCGVS